MNCTDGRCPRCGRFMRFVPEHEGDFIYQPPHYVCTRQACLDAEEAEYERACEAREDRRGR